MFKNTVRDMLIAKLKQDPKETVANINYTTQFITHVGMENIASDQYKILYSDLEKLCGRKEIISSNDNEVAQLENFLNSAPNNIIFLIESLTRQSSICALDMYHLHYEDNNEKLLDYSKIKEDALLHDIYIDNGANAGSFALATAVYFFQQADFEF